MEGSEIIPWVISFAVFFVVPFWKLLNRTGFKPVFSIIALIPGGVVLLLWVVAFAKWPAFAEKKKDSGPPITEGRDNGPPIVEGKKNSGSPIAGKKKKIGPLIVEEKKDSGSPVVEKQKDSGPPVAEEIKDSSSPVVEEKKDSDPPIPL